MSYNKAPRRSLTTLQRAKLFEEHGGICYLCGLKIHTGEAWDDEHVISRELMGEGADDWSNRRPAHRKCHKPKTAQDQKLIAKSNRVRAKHMGAHKPKKPQSIFKRKVNGQTVLRATGEPV
jgi:5-methylcytosine-specific restriction protein A